MGGCCCKGSDGSTVVEAVELNKFLGNGTDTNKCRSTLLEILPTKSTNPQWNKDDNNGFLSLFDLGFDLDGDGKDDDFLDLILSITTGELLKKVTYDILIDIVTELFNLPGPPKMDNEGNPLKRKPIQEFDNTRSPHLMAARNVKFVSPANRRELCQIVEDAVHDGMHIKAMGTGYGFANITYTDGVIIDMFDHLETVDIGYDAGLLNTYGLKTFHEGGHLLCCESGCSYEQIQLYLWPYEKRRLLRDENGRNYQFFPDTTGYTGLSLGGTVGVGAMGAGTPDNYGGVCRYVASFCMLIINENREVCFVQIEPSVGNGAIHDKRKWDAAQARIKNVRERTQLIQDDDVFDAALVSVGLMGIFYSFVLKLEDVYFVKETRVMMTFHEFAEKYQNEYLPKVANGSISRMVFWFSPYKLLVGEYSESTPVVVTLLQKTNELPVKSANIFNAGGGRSDDSTIIAAAALITWLSRVTPSLVPFAMYMALKASAHKGVVLSCVEALEFGEGNAVPSYAIGVSTHANYALDVGSDFIKLCNQLRDNDKRQLVTGPFSLRFGPAQRGFLQMAENQPTVWMESGIPNFDNTEWKAGSVQKWENTFREMQHFFLSDKYRGRLHLGLWMDVSPDIWKYYSNIDKFVAQYKRFNYYGYFCNEFSVQSGLDSMAGIPKSIRRLNESGNQSSRRLFETVANNTKSIRVVNEKASVQKSGNSFIYKYDEDTEIGIMI